MLRNRLIFGLIYSDGAFMQSRNFRLQRVGDINWLEKNYKLQKISFSLDELVVLNASRKDKSIETFSATVRQLVNDVFIPVAAGGGVRTLQDADCLFKSGADKVVLNTILFDKPDVVREITGKYGEQSVIASVDYRLEGDFPVVYVENGTRVVDRSLSEYLMSIQNLGVGEILLNSIDQDGTGFGYDFSTLAYLDKVVTVPLIIMGGAGNEFHLHQGLIQKNVSAVATANLFNFIGNSLPIARKYLISNGVNISSWK